MARLDIASAGDRRCQKCRNRTSMALNHNVNYIFWDFLEWHDPLNQNYVRFIPDQILKLKWTPTARWKKTCRARIHIFALIKRVFAFTYPCLCHFLWFSSYVVDNIMLTTLWWRQFFDVDDTIIMLVAFPMWKIGHQHLKSVTKFAMMLSTAVTITRHQHRCCHSHPKKFDWWLKSSFCLGHY